MKNGDFWSLGAENKIRELLHANYDVQTTIKLCYYFTYNTWFTVRLSMDYFIQTKIVEFAIATKKNAMMK